MLPVFNISKRVGEESLMADLPMPGSDPMALVYMPWGSASRGSIAVGIIKQCARKLGIEPDVHYLNIKFAEMLGVELYESISDSSAFFPEWYFSCALFGPQGLGLMKNTWEDLLSTELGSKMAERLKDITRGSELLSRQLAEDIIPRYIDECVTSVDWSKYRVIGFSATFAQTISSLLLSRRIKDRHPDTKIVFGGANVDSEMGFEIIKAFDWVDYVVHGEAEESFPRLLKNIYAERYAERVPGVSLRDGERVVAGFSEAATLKDLDQSPMPDYTDFIREAERAGIHKKLRIKLSFESSRGCWWGAKQHCTFCGLNGNTMAFRKKTASRVYDEILNIAGQYRCLTLTAVDNILDMGYFKQLLPRLAEADLDLSIFYEVKANLSREQVRKLANSGITKIQPGIESFNSEILRLMRKGCTAIQNVQLLKWCLEFGIDPAWNILYGFPGENAGQYQDLPQLLRLLFHLRPPAGITPVIFERFSPYHFEKEKFKLSLTPFPLYQMIYPEHLIDYGKVAYYFHGKWEDQQGDPQEYIRPSIEAYEEWVRHWQEDKIFFYYEKGPGFLTLHDNRPLRPGAEMKVRILNLNEKQAKVYLFCDEIRSFSAIQQMLNENFENAPVEERTRVMLEQFVERGLMFQEGDRYLSLAVRKAAGRSRRYESAEE
jgi:ribosomal peptide maturation radical SAM protein 1